MQDHGSKLRSISLPRTRVNKGEKKGRGFSSLGRFGDRRVSLVTSSLHPFLPRLGNDA